MSERIEELVDLDEWGRRPRQNTDRTQGVWTTCDDCGEDWWCVVTERDWMDEAVAFGCSGGCDDGWDPDDLLPDEGCDCEAICSMGPTCPGAFLARLDGAGCYRTATTADQIAARNPGLRVESEEQADE